MLKQFQPDAYEALGQLETTGIKCYQQFIESTSNKNLLVALTSLSLEKKLNISSRAGAKVNVDDPTNVRAIGVVNLYLLAGSQWDVFMSLLCVLELPMHSKEHFSILFEKIFGFHFF